MPWTALIVQDFPVRSPILMFGSPQFVMRVARCRCSHLFSRISVQIRVETGWWNVIVSCCFPLCVVTVGLPARHVVNCRLTNCVHTTVESRLANLVDDLEICPACGVGFADRIRVLNQVATRSRGTTILNGS